MVDNLDPPPEGLDELVKPDMMQTPVQPGEAVSSERVQAGNRQAALAVDKALGFEKPKGDELQSAGVLDPIDLLGGAAAAKIGSRLAAGLAKTPFNPLANPEIKTLASEYAKQQRLKLKGIAPVTVDPDRGARIAQVFEAAKHDPLDPKVQKAYKALADETLAQYRHLREQGFNFTKIQPGQANPYPNGSKDIIADLKDNKHLHYFPTESGFGTAEGLTQHPLLAKTGEKLNGEELLANDVFRIVHDVYGHGKEGTTFGPKGEEAAWRVHKQMYSPEAQRALATETRGQNSWVNYGPKGEANRANPANTTYAEQKAAILPDWVNEDEAIDPAAHAGGFAEGGEVPDMSSLGIESAPVQQQTFSPNPDPAPPGLDELTAPILKEQKYGSMGQQALAGLEGAAQGVAGPLATMAETKLLGVKPEDIRGREEVNPGTHTLGEVAGFAGPLIASGGASALGKAGFAGAAKVAPALEAVAGMTEAGALGMAGQAAEKAAGSFIVNQTAKDAVKGAFEGALYQGGEELNRMFKEDPNQTADSAIADIGLATVMSGVFGGAIGAGLRQFGHGAKAAENAAAGVAPGKFVSEADRIALDSGDLATAIRYSDDIPQAQKDGILDTLINKSGLRKEKSNIADIRSAAKELGDAPVLEGMASASEAIQMAEDTLIRNPSTYAGMKRQELYDSAYKHVNAAVDEVLGEGSKLSKAQVGNVFKDELAAKLESEAAPISALYDYVKQFHSVIPLAERAAPAVARELKHIPEFRIAPSSPQGQLVKRVMGELENLKTVDDVKAYKTFVRQSLSGTASPGERKVANIIMDKLTALEDASVERFATKMKPTANGSTPDEIRNLIGMRKTANKQYAQFMDKVSTLSDQLGKGKVHGLQDALHFIQDLTPEQVTNRLFSKNNSEFLSFFKKEFPDQMERMREYQKGVMREASTRDDVLSSRRLFTQVNKLEPEIMDSLFSKEQIKKLGAAETYLNAFPKNYNPSGTSHIGAFREAFSSPKASVIANARDLAIEKFIKGVVKTPEASNAVSLAKATIQGDNLARRSIKAVIGGSKEGIPAAIIPIASHRKKLDALVTQYQVNPEKMLSINDNNPVPEYGQAFAATTQRAVTYLASVKPDTQPKSPLDPVLPPNPFKQAAYDRALDIAQQPLSVLSRMQQGTLTPTDVQTLQAIYPSMYRRLSQQIVSEVTDYNNKGKEIPYQQRMQMSMFLAQPLDSTMTASSIMALQRKPSNKTGATPTQPAQGQKHTTSGLDGLAKMAMTPSQARSKR